MFSRKCSRIWHSSRHRPLLRNLFYGLVLLVALYTLYHLVPRNTTDFFSDFLNTEADASPELWNERAEQVKQAFVHAYHGYERYASPNDELKPITRGKINNFNGWGVTVFDSLDTIYLLGLNDEFERALMVVKQTNFSVSVGNGGFAPYFETVIRYLGGLLSAYALSKDHMLLERAEDLAIVLDPIFDTPSGMPFYSVNPTTGEHRGPEIGILAEIASLQVEYTYLAKITGGKQYFQRADAVSKTLARAKLRDTGGMFPIQWNLTSGEPIGYRLSVGAQGDSAHEYLLKQYLLTAKTDKASLEMYLRATTHIITNLMYISPTRHLAYVTDSATSTFWELGEPTHIFEHLSCFLPGMLALGAHTLPLDNLDEVGINFRNLGDQATATLGYAAKGFKTLRNYNLTEIHLWAAESLAQTCWLTYADQPSGLGPDEIMMKTIHQDSPPENYLWIKAIEKWRKSGARGPVPGVADRKPVVYSEKERLSGKGVGRDYVLRKPGYLLRPETLESLYILWRVTGDSKWRTRSWTIFEAIERETKTPSGYASLRSVEMSPAPKEDSMPSYFLAETLKYLYLILSGKDPLPLNEWVFNTEAHPFPVFEWSEEEKKAFEM